MIFSLIYRIKNRKMDFAETFKRYFGCKGFTIIETLVAVAILMISIAGPLTIAHKGLLAAVYAHDNVTASYLAQDAMEYIKNVKDYNILRSTETSPPGFWLSGLVGVCTSSNSCRIDTINYSTTQYG